MFEKYASLQSQPGDSPGLVREKARAREHLALLIHSLGDAFEYKPARSSIMLLCKRDKNIKAKIFPSMKEYRDGNWDHEISAARMEYRRKYGEIS